MLKYVDTKVTFAEVPNEISLCINISNCPCACKGCHSPYLAEDIGNILDIYTIVDLVDANKGITCICLMGGDSCPKEINTLAKNIQRRYVGEIKVAWYSGRQELNEDIKLRWFNYIKLGPYIEELGPLNNKNTNQRFYIVEKLYCGNDNYKYDLKDITYKFWKDND